ncbi:DUF7507 domain-containing protein [Algoriphagus halophytocola]|uniref:Gliding motility-associated C-terminal domain-containing protein n=1 Tax=Algoriphagus halophytocola TaxID=2991499 RepID=A0ABY6MDE0_9BACT|nr:gliding motility-associated C-terminal domain-containing protein [Algoriphagus sp. TR-M5]UZD21773.1 gliding motility-associated C-terminal domain-containing protein [Algoriphagus sp. TR-M5]
MDSTSNCQFSARPQQSGFFERATAYRSLKGFLTAGLLLLLFFASGQVAFSQGLGDPIFIEDFGTINDGETQHVFNDTRSGTNGRGVYFKYESLDYITSMDFYTPQRWGTNQFPYQNQYRSSGPSIPGGVSYNTSPAGANNNVQNGNWGPVFANISESNGTGIGGYSITNDSRGYYQPYFAIGTDHTTEDAADYTGYMLLIDAHSSTTLYFDRKIDGLCAGTKFRFSVWIKDMNGQGGEPPKVNFKILNGINDNLITSKATTDDDVDPAGEWKQLYIDFQMPAGVSSVRLQIENIVGTQYGNDLAIDDISFAPLGPPAELIGLDAVCVGEDPGLKARITDADPEFAYSTNYFQLQYREADSPDEWINIGSTLSNSGSSTDYVDFPNPYAQPGSPLDPLTGYEFRVVVAGDPTTLENEFCRVVSPKFINVYRHEVALEAELEEICIGSSTTISAAVSNGIGTPTYTYVWEKEVGGNWEVIPNENSSTLNTGALSESTTYRAKALVNNCPGSGYSDPITVTAVACTATIEKVITNLANIPIVTTPGQTVNYRVTVSNPSSLDLTGVVVTDLLPDGSAGILVQSQGSDDDGILSPSETWVYTISYTANNFDLQNRTELINTATVDSNETEPKSDTASIAILPSVDCENENSSYDFQCNAQDITVSEFYLGDPITGDELESCVAGSSQSAGIWTVFGGANQGGNNERYSLLVKYQLYVNDEFVEDVELELFGSTNIPRGVPIKITDYTWTCGDKIEFKDFFMSWSANQNSWDVSGPRCIKCFTGFVVNAPLVANFEYSGACESTQVAFTDKSTGGDNSNYSYTWTFGNNLGNSNASNPSFDFGNPGTYDVTLEITDGDETTSITKQVTIDEPVTVSGSSNGEVCFGANDGTVSITPDGGDGSYSYSWTGPNSFTSNDQNLTGLSPGTYEVKVTDSKGCFVIEEYIVGAGEQVGLPNTTDKEYCKADEDFYYIVSPTSANYEIVYYTTQVSNDGTTTAPAVDGNNVGDYSVWVSQRNTTSGCESVRKEVEISIIDLPVLVVQSPDPVCGPADIDLADAIDLQGTSQGADFTYYKQGEPGEISSTVSESGTYIIRATIGECYVEEEVEVVINECAIAIIKTVAPTTADDCVEAGDELTYTFVVRNTGTVTLGSVAVAELSFSGTGTAPAITFVAAESDNVEGTLAPGEEATYTATYVVTPADVEAGLITNQARATGQFGQNTPVTDDSGESFEVDGLTEFELCQKESIAIIKTVAPTTADDCVEAGDELTYTFVVRNTGTVTLGNVSVAELSFSGTGTAPAITFVAAESDNVEGTLAPGEEATYTATYVVTPADVEAGLITNQARATGQFGQNTPVTDDSGESFEVDGLTEFELCQKESIAIIKTVAPTTADDCVEAGDELTYTFVVRNTGTVTLGNVSVSELSFSGTGTAPAITFVAAESDNVEGTLAPGEEATYTATYVVTPADVEAGLITNQARATGQFGQNTPVTDDSGESFEVDGLTEFELCQKESIAIIKTVAPTTADDCVEAGDELTYTFVVRNTGTVTLGNVSVSELSFSGTGTAPAITFVAAESDNVEGTLAPGEEATYTATYVVTPADVEAGLITNQARATGQFGQNTPVTDDSGESFEVDGLTEFELCQKESIAIIKTVAPTTADDCVEAGDELTYTFVVRNTGTVTLGNVSVSELSFSGTGTAPAITFVAAESDNVEGTLAPGEEATYTATYVVTPADVEAGLITNQARATGQFGQNTPVTDDSGESFEVDGLTEFELCQKESIAIIKTVAPTTADDCVEAGDELTYTFVVRNTGTVTLGNVSVSELSFSGTGTAPAITFVAAESDNVEGTLAPGEEATYTATYVVTPADVEAGLITNQARATGQFGQNTPVTDDSGESFEVDGLTEFELCQKESIAIIKTVAPTTADDCVEAGDELTYTFVVRNTGTVTLGNVSVSELSFSGTGTAPAITFVAAESDNVEGTLAPGEEATYTATYVVTPADVEAGLITNQARATGQFGQNTPVTDDSGESFEVDGLTEFELCQKESIAIIKTVAPTTADDCVEAGDELTYTFVVRNTGTVTLGNVSVSELSFSGTGTAPAITFVAAESDNVEGTLAPGEEATYTATYVVTPADVEAGLITNQARATGQFGQNTPVTDDSGESFEVDGLTEFELCQKESIAIIKTVAPTTADDCVEAGDELTYTFVVRNTGTVTLGNVSVSELSFSGTGTAPAITFVAAESDNVEGTLAPGEEATYTATYVVTPADVEAGLITNQARATGQFGQNTPVTDDSGESFEVDGLTEFELCQKESIAIIKTVAPTTADDCVEAGDELTYTFVVRNTGTVTLGNVSVSELSFSGTGTAPAITFVAAESDNVEGTLAPGEEATYTATYVVTPADVEAGLITNQARATGQFGQNTPVTDDSGESFEVDGLTEFELCQKESIAIIKTVAPTTADDCVEAGDELTYTFVVRNTGTVTLGNVSVSELSFSGTGTAPAITFVAAESDNVEGTLAPGEEATYTATYVVTPADVEAGLITNQARATGQFGQNTPVTDDSGESFEVDGLTEFELCQKESIAIIKTVAPTTADDCVEAGDELTYTFVVRNTGTVTLGNVSVSELSFSGTGTAPAITFVAAESDNVEGTLAPGEEATYTATYVVTPADVEAGLITNQARATGQFGQNTPVTDDSGESFEVDGLTEFELCQKESIAIIKTVAPTTADDCVEAGDELTYTFVVRNTGTVTLGNVSVSELSFSGTGTAPAITFVAAESDNVEGTLAPGEEATYTATYVVTPADVEAGLITNQARATGQFGQNTPVTDDSGESFEVDGLTEFELCQKESIAIIKTVAPTTADDCVEAGDELTYTFVVRNTGTVTLGNVSVSELSFSGTGTAPAITFVAAESDNVEGTLAPGEEATYTATYVVTPADVEAGLITNQARATGQFGQNTPVTDDSGESFEVDGLTEFELCQKESIAIIKTVAPTTADDCVEAGDELTYTFVVRNTGTVTLGNVSVAELSFSGTGTAPAITFVAAESDNVEGTLAPGEEATYTATYVVTPADVEAGLITNQARATGQFGQNTPVTDDSGESFEVDGLTEFELCQKESIAIIKTVAPTTADDCVEAGDELTYTFVVRNTGTVTLGNVSVSELSFSGTGTAPAITFVAAESDNVEGTLAPGEEATYTATYVVTPADVEAGLITNQARATGQFGQNTPVTDDSGESFEVDGLTEFELCQKESIAIIKTVAPTTADDCVEAGDELTYTFVVRNTGTVTLGNVSVSELSFSGTGTAPAITFVAAESDNVEGTLAPGEEATYTATYVVTPADVEAGLITNQARATGQFGQNTPVTDDSGESFEVDGLTEFELCQKESIAIIKTVAPTTADDCVEAGDELTYTFVVRNTGTVTLGNVSVSELSFSGTGTAPAITFVAAESDNVEGTLAPGEEATYTATYVVTPADVEAGLITNQARATGQFGQNTPVTDDSGESFEVDGLTEFELCQKESIAIIKTVAPTTADDCVEAGDELTYTFVVRNTGTVTLGNVSVSELSFSGTGTAPAITFVAAESDNVEGTLAPGEEATYTATYVVTPADVEAGLITNQARATGQFGQNTPVTDDSGESFEVDGLTEFELCQKAEIAIIKTASVDSEDDCYDTDDLVTYTFTVFNTGNVTLTDVEVTEYHFTGSGDISDITFVESSEDSEEGTLLPGESATYTATYTLTLEDTDARFVNNQALVTALFGENEVDDLSGDTVQDDNETQVDLCQNPGLEITKTVSSNAEILDGDLIFDITVKNTGNVTLYNIYVEDIETEDNWTIDELAPNAEDTRQVTVKITQEMIDGICYENTAIAESREFIDGQQQSPGEGEFPGGLLYRVVAQDEDMADACFPQTPELTIVKEITAGDPYSLVDDVVEYSYTLENTGNVTLYGPFTVEDDKIAGTIVDENSTASMAPGDEIVFTATYAITAADLEEGTVTNTAIGKGFIGEGEGQEPIESDPDSETAEASFNEILAVDDFAGTFDYETTAQTSAVNALTNDELKGGQATPANVTLTTVIADPEGVLSVDANGEITIAPNPQAGNYQLTYRITETGNPSNWDEAVITVTINPELGLIEVDEYCELDAPYLRWLLSPVNFDLQDLAPNDPNPLTMTWYDKDDNVIISYDNIPMEGYMLFPGADTLAGGYGSAWPGWKFENQQWVAGEFNFYQVREDGAYVIFELNPEVQAEIAYPGASAECNPNPNPPIAEDDDMTSIPVYEFGYDDIVNVLTNDRLLDGTSPLNTTLVTVTEVTQSTPGALILDTNTGLVSVASGLTPGVYTLEYRICTNPNPTNCDTALVTVRVVSPGLDIEKEVVENDNEVGGFVTYAIKVTNTGDVELYNIEVKDGLTGEMWTIQSLAPQATWEEETQLEIDQDLIDGLCVTNTASATAYEEVYEQDSEFSEGRILASDEDSIEECFETSPSINLVKTAEVESEDDCYDTGDSVTYTFVITNTGNVTLNSVTLEEVNFTGTGDLSDVNFEGTSMGSSEGTLKPGETATYTASYIITLDDTNARFINNQARATGIFVETEVQDLSGESIDSDVETQVDLCQRPAIELLKDGVFNDENQDGFGNVGETISYTFTVSNTGNVTLSNIMVTDPMVTVNGGPISLAPGASDNTTFTATYVLTQDDIDNGYVVNTALAQGTSPTNEVVEDESSDPTPVENPSTECETCTETEIPQNPAIELLKDGVFNDENQDGFGNVGETISYTFTVSNTGNVTLSNIMVTDPMVTVNGGPISLAPGVSDNTTFTATYVLTQDDIDNGYVVNTALAQGTSPKDEVVEDESSDPTPVENPSTECETCTETEIPQNPAIELLKDGVFNDENQDGFGNVGETISYTFTVSNTGNVTLSNIMVTDPMVTVNGGPISLAPGVSDNTTFTATYVLTQDDIDNGYVVNTALAQGTSPKDEVVEDESSDPTPVENPSTECETCTETEIPQNPAIELLKDGVFNDENQDGFGNVGETISYTFTVSNTGNVTLSNIMVTDPMVTVNGGPISLAPGVSDNTTFTATYVLTQDDIDNGYVVNTALAQGTSPTNEVVEDESSDPTPVENPSTECETCTETEIPQNPAIQIVKSDNGAEVNAAGDVITYTLTVTNTGNVTLTKVMVSDPLTGLDQNAGTLAPGASTALNTEYVVTQADVDAGFVLNTALASGESPDGEDPEDETEIETPIDPLPSITLGKTVDVTSVSEAGVVLNYTLLVKNTGNVTLTSGELTDPKTGLAVGSLTLAPGEERSFQTTYTVTLEDILSGEPILNVATVKAVHENSETPVEAEDDATVNVDLTAGIQIDKTADKTVVYEIGEVITYTITVTNTGTAPLVDVQVNDPMTGFTESVEMLLPNEVLEYSTTYTVTESDIANQENLVNVATVTATNPVDPENPVSEEDDHVVEVGCEGQTLITGIAFNAETDLPLAGVPITLIPQGDTPGSTLLVITGADGRYTFQDFAPGSYLVQVQDANLNAARGLYPVESSLFFTDIADCAYQTHDFGYETYDGIVLGDFVWYDLNGDGIQNEWFDANNDGQVTLNDPTQGPIDIADWEWFDLNGDGRYDGPENEGELNKAGFGNAQSANVHVDGPGGYAADIIVGIIGYWRDRPEGVEFGEFTAYLNNDEFLDAEAQRMGATGLVKVLPDASARMTDINASRTEVRCGVTGGADGITAQITAENPVNLDMDFGMRCLEVDVEIIANDDDFGTHFISFGGLLGNILDNDRLEGERPDPADVDFEFTELDGIVGLLIDENGELSLIPGVNEAREYTLRYTLREVAFPDNQDDALVVFRLMNDEVNLNITKTSFEQEIFVGDEFEYEIVLSNIGGTPATNVVVTDNLPNGVSYLSSEVTANSSGAEIATNEAGSQLSWTIPFLEADATVTIRVKVLAETAGAITNVVVVDSEEEDTDEADNQDDDVNTIKPFHIPNVITPNNDGDNDTFEIEGINIFQSTEITIINRFGDHVLEQENYQNDWDAPGQTAGTYYYVLKAIDRSGQEHEYKGWIQVIKD